MNENGTWRIHELLFSMTLGSVVAVLLLHAVEHVPPSTMLGQVLDSLQHSLRLGYEYRNWLLAFSAVFSGSVFLLLRLRAWSAKGLSLISGFLAVAGPFVCWYSWRGTDIVSTMLLAVPTIIMGHGVYLALQRRKQFSSTASFLVLLSYFGFWAYVIARSTPQPNAPLVIPTLGFLSCVAWAQYISKSLKSPC